MRGDGPVGQGAEGGRAASIAASPSGLGATSLSGLGVLHFAAVADDDAGAFLPGSGEERGEAVVVVLSPGGEGMGVAASAGDLDSQERRC